MTRKRIRVAYILTPITFGGAEKVSLNFLRTVDRSNFDVRPILLVRPWEEETYLGRELRDLGYSYKTIPVALKAEGHSLRALMVAYRLHSHLKKGSFDLIHTHGYFADICGQFAAILLDISGISTCHGFIETDLKLRLYNSLAKYILRSCKTVIAVSEMIKAELVLSGLQDNKVTVISNAVPDSGCEDNLDARREKRILLNIEPEEYVIGYLGRVSEEKGLVYLIKAVIELLDEEIPLKLVIVGDGKERKKLEQQVKARGIEYKVIFAGFQTDPENWYSAFDLFVLPSLTEGTPLALLECMAAGVPVIASAVGGVPKIVEDGVNGFLVPPGDCLAIKKKIMFLHGDMELSSRLGKAGIERIKKDFSIDSWCRRVESCYRGVYQDCRPIRE